MAQDWMEPGYTGGRVNYGGESQQEMVYRMNETKRPAAPAKPYTAPKLDAKGRYTEGLGKGWTPAEFAEAWYNK